ncbi:asparaginase [Brucella anthropi]|uniref:asparaginase domain-containing protein n=1 Tax=Brucella anthropi TaxID=529 RepID=UPI000DEC15F3|nr:asparaginase domain-containing protein [Brucella anthropi]RCI77216.1 asparaginase [Brucella anthropi]
MQRTLRIIVTGGTLDKIHDTYSEALAFDPDARTHLPEMLRVARCHFPAVECLFLKDSLHFIDADREVIANAITRASEETVVLTHGTGTMGQTARFLAERASDKTVVLTGAIRPYSFGNSDAMFNLGGAITAAQVLPHGVWAVPGRWSFLAGILHQPQDRQSF